MRAQTTVYLEPAQDNTLYEWIGVTPDTVSNGAGQYLFAGMNAVDEIRRAVLRFEVAETVPVGATVTAATLTLNVSRTISGPTPVGLHRLQASWGEGASDAGGQEGGGTVPQAPDATWWHRTYNGTFWATPGGDFAPTISASQAVDGLGPYIWGSTAQMVADVQGWLDNPGANYGWIVRGDETTSGSAKRFDSRQHPVTANRPLLCVTYTGGLPVELAHFQATVVERNVHLTWTTLSEENNAGWDVEMEQADGFRGVGYVAGAGASMGERSYELVVTDVSPGSHRFRLRQLDLDGSFEYSGTLEVNVEIPEAYFVSDIYPNPFNPATSLEVAVSQRQRVRVEAVDLLGRTVALLMDGSLAAEERRVIGFDAAHLTSGIYTILITGETFRAARTAVLLK